eukprot:CAMPEP_0117471916 /NCGR_PEP_ID=MMETSP0784-20121206/7976_1 /TAXON_ID=39447 /ORGANISM="" /LENGTH=613 /DNA_ID=CAMNT_0005266047 /DNA_START=79 /DNA_END=1917 /DNA_ORIENTATION=+
MAGAADTSPQREPLSKLVLSVKYDNERKYGKAARYVVEQLGEGRVYNPNSFMKGDCCPNAEMHESAACSLCEDCWQGSCTKTFAVVGEAAARVDPTKVCWRSSFYAHLQNSKGMLRVLENGTLGSGQQIEARMAENLGMTEEDGRLKVIRVNVEPKSEEQELRDKWRKLTCVSVLGSAIPVGLGFTVAFLFARSLIAAGVDDTDAYCTTTSFGMLALLFPFVVPVFVKIDLWKCGDLSPRTLNRALNVFLPISYSILGMFWLWPWCSILSANPSFSSATIPVLSVVCTLAAMYFSWRVVSSLLAQKEDVVLNTIIDELHRNALLPSDTKTQNNKLTQRNDPSARCPSIGGGGDACNARTPTCRSLDGDAHCLDEVPEPCAAVGSVDSSFFDLMESTVDADVEKDMQPLDNIFEKAHFAYFQSASIFLLWLVAAFQKMVDGNWKFATTRAGLDTLFKGSTDLRIGGQSCEDYRWQVWRWFSYPYTHEDLPEMLLNCFITLLFGIPLERVSGSIRMSLLYTLTILGGALAYFLTGAEWSFVGCMPGTYGMLAAQLSETFTNWGQHRYRKPKVLFVIILMAFDLPAFAILPGQMGGASRLAVRGGGFAAGLLGTVW